MISAKLEEAMRQEFEGAKNAAATEANARADAAAKTWSQERSMFENSIVHLRNDNERLFAELCAAQDEIKKLRRRRGKK